MSEIDDRSDIHKLVRAHLPSSHDFEEVAQKIVDFWAWYGAREAVGKMPLSLRDMLAWCEFVSATAEALGPLPALLHGAFAVIIDGQGMGRSLSLAASDMKKACTDFLFDATPSHLAPVKEIAACTGDSTLPEIAAVPAQGGTPTMWGIRPFAVCTGPLFNGTVPASYHLEAPTTSRNCFRILRTMQLAKPILLEGSPGVGKTSIVAAVAAAAGHELVRINLSDQTEMLDLLGADLPSPDGAPGVFAWADGPLLRALRRGSWVLLDELNLASQAVLEGLNSILDHRRAMFIPELGETVVAPASFRVFAAQNPLHEGGGRKGLPRSFLNRFSRVSLELLLPADLLMISSALYPQIPPESLQCMVATTTALHDAINTKRAFGHTGGPWEFNLRDVTRWCDLLVGSSSSGASSAECAAHYARMLFVDKLHTVADQARAAEVITGAWRQHPQFASVPAALQGAPKVAVALSPQAVRVGMCTLDRSGPAPDCLPPFSVGARGAAANPEISGLDMAALGVPALEWTATACKMAWMAILVSHDAPRAAQLVRMLGRLCAQPLVEIPMTPMSDTSDLLGGFEQLDTRRLAKAAEARVRHAASVMCMHALCHGVSAVPQAAVQQLQEMSSIEIPVGSDARSGERAALLLQRSVGSLRSLHASLQWSPSVGDALGTLLPAAAAAVAAAVEALDANASTSTGGRFVWVDGLLLSAIEHGHWVLMQHANTCSAAVLDRLNSLLEPSGVLVVSESGSTDSGPRIVKPHSNFRLFLVMDPSEGGLSRAMRNRGVEVFLEGHQFSPDPAREFCAVCPSPPGHEAPICCCPRSVADDETHYVGFPLILIDVTIMQQT